MACTPAPGTGRPALSDEWITAPYEPAAEAPEGEPDHDCTGEGDDGDGR